MRELLRLEVNDAAAWRRWLEVQHVASPGVWLVFRKAASRKPDGLRYDEALDEALCFGWIDSIVKRLDEECYLRKFTPRTNRANWSEINLRHVRRLTREGRMTAAGRAAIGVPLTAASREKAVQSGDERKRSPALSGDAAATFVRTALRARPGAAAFFEALSPSCQRRYLAWITSARLQETRERRLAEALGLLERGVKTLLK